VKIESNEEIELKFTLPNATAGTVYSSWSHPSLEYKLRQLQPYQVHCSSSFSQVKIENPSLHFKVVLNGSSNKTVLLVVREMHCTISACQASLILWTNKYNPTLWQWMSCLFLNTILLRDNKSPAYFDDKCNTAHVIIWQLWNIGGSLISLWGMFLLQTREYILLAIGQNFPYLK
jgi:hypothetical protein